MVSEVVINPSLIFLIGILAIWELIWKVVASWKAGRNNQPVWFVFILIMNTLGILPIIYIIWFQKNKNHKKIEKKVSKKK